MYMSKQRKRTANLTTLNRAFALAMNYSTQPDEFKRELMKFRKRIKEARMYFGLTDCIEKPPTITRENMELLQHYAKAENRNDCASIMMQLMMDEWYKHKRVFIFPQETIDYVLNSFPEKYIPVPINECIHQVCRPPIYIECPDSKSYMGIFWGECSFSNEEFDKGDGYSIKTIGVVANDDSNDIFVHKAPNCSITDYYKILGDNAPEINMVKLLIYLYFVSTRKDAVGTVLIPQTRTGSNCWKVEPLPNNCAIPAKSDINSLISSGLGLRLGFLFRENFVKEMQIMQVNTEKFKDYDIDTASDEEKQFWCQYNLARMSIDWEQYRVIFKYNDKSERCFLKKYYEDVMFGGFDPELLKYFPQNTIIIYQENNDVIFLASPSQTQNSSTSSIIFCVLTYKHSTFLNIPVNQRGVTFAPNQSLLEENISGICALYHILHVYQSKALKKLTKTTLTAGNPSIMALQPVPPTVDTKYQPINVPADFKPVLYRNGELIEDVPFELFSLTESSIVRQRQEEKIIRMGWKMTPHTRRPHPHRYWVGKGATRHLEVRWLERIQIHKEQKVESTTIHTLK